jgi:ABC-type multidrug transport system fused ATPase/permease subunit
MIIKGLFLKFIKSNKIVYFFIFLSCIIMFLQVIISSIIYRKFLDKNIKENFQKLIKQICLLWISIFILYYIRSNIDCSIAPNVNTFVRRELIVNYIKTNEINYNDKDAEKDHTRMIDVGYFSQKLFTWVCESVFPIILIMIIMNIYFLIKCPIVGVINLISNIINIIIINTYYPKLMEKISKKRSDYNKFVLNMSESINNLMNIYTTGKINETIDKNDSTMEYYKTSLKNEMNIVNEFINCLRINVYISTILSIFFLYKYTKNIESFFEIFPIFILYIPIFQNITNDIPIKAAFFIDLVLILDNLVKNKKLTVDNNGYLSTLNYPYLYCNKNMNNCKGNIVFDNITFSYES